MSTICTVFSWISRGFLGKRGNSVLETYRVKKYTLPFGGRSSESYCKGRQTRMRGFCGHFAMFYPGPHELNWPHELSSFLGLQTGLWQGEGDQWGLLSDDTLDYSGATQNKERLPCPTHRPDCVYSAFPPLTLNELTVFILKTNSSTCSLEAITSHLFKDVSPANYTLSSPSSSTVPFIQAKSLNHLSVWSLYQPLNCSLCFHPYPSSPLQFIPNIAVRSGNFV